MYNKINVILKGKNILCKVFYYKSYDFNEQTGDLVLNYAVSEGNTVLHTFEEHLYFPKIPFSLTESQRLILNDIFFLTHIAFGISYYKTFCPETIIIESGVLSQTQAVFFNRFYVNGLGEFAVRNNMNLQGKISFPYGEGTTKKHNTDLKNRYLVPVGGGKDSCLTLEILKKIGLDCQAISVGLPRPIQECIHVSALDSIALTRKISPHLIELNQSGTVKNGHVPITGMLAFVLWASAVLYNYQYVALSCERSANNGNLMQGDLMVNHQYSKSFEFEQNFYEITRAITPDFRYFSLLRPLSEIAIARLFACECQAYFPVFTSCNKAFKLDETKRLERWCGNCDKCRFVFLILAPFVDKEILVRYVGTNPLNDDTQTEGFKELLGLSGHKPFECVGEIEESRYAFMMLSEQPQWQNDAVIQALIDSVRQVQNFNDLPDLFTPSGAHLIPSEIETQIMQKFRS